MWTSVFLRVRGEGATCSSRWPFVRVIGVMKRSSVRDLCALCASRENSRRAAGLIAARGSAERILSTGARRLYDRRMAIELRAAEATDADAIAAVFGAARRSALAYLPVAAQCRGGPCVLRRRRRRRAARPWRWRTGTSSRSSPLGEARVEHLYVEPPHWRQGIGTTLLRAAQAARPGRPGSVGLRAQHRRDRVLRAPRLSHRRADRRRRQRGARAGRADGLARRVTGIDGA